MIGVFLLAVAVTPREDYQALLRQYDAPLEVYHRDLPRAKAACQPFLRLAREHSDDPAAVDALHWVVTHTFLQVEAGQAMDLLVRDHSRDERLGQICRELDRQYGNSFQPLVNLFRAVLRNNPSREVQGVTCLALARRLKRDHDQRDSEWLQHEAEKSGLFFGLGEPKGSIADLARMGRESEALYRRVIDEFGDIKDDDGTLGAAARLEKALSSGRIAPEIEGEDVDGKPFKLSDYRGKVVVLNFWAKGCAVCRASFPEERALVKRMEGQPFVMLGINNGDSPDDLRKLRETGEITWRFWVDGDLEDGKIFKAWNVQRWPTIVIVDRDGVIRHQGFSISMSIPLMEYAAKSLMAENETAGR